MIALNIPQPKPAFSRFALLNALALCDVGIILDQFTIYQLARLFMACIYNDEDGEGQDLYVMACDILTDQIHGSIVDPAYDPIDLETITMVLRDCGFWDEENQLTPFDLNAEINTALGEASVCWSDINKAGEFQSNDAISVGRRLTDLITKKILT